MEDEYARDPSFRERQGDGAKITAAAAVYSIAIPAMSSGACPRKSVRSVHRPSGCFLTVTLVFDQARPCPSPSLQFKFDPTLGLRKAAQHMKK